MNTVLFVNTTIGFSENLFLVIVAFFKNTTIEYSLESLCVSVRNRSRNMKLEYSVVCESSSDKFNIEHHRIKVKVTVGLQMFYPFTKCQVL